MPQGPRRTETPATSSWLTLSARGGAGGGGCGLEVVFGGDGVLGLGRGEAHAVRGAVAGHEADGVDDTKRAAGGAEDDVAVAELFEAVERAGGADHGTPHEIVASRSIVCGWRVG